MGHSHKRQIETRLTVVSTLIYQARKPPWGQASCGSTRLRDVWWFASTGAWVCLSLCVCVWLLLLKDMHLYTGAVSHVKPLAWTLIVRWKKLSSSILTRVLTHSNILTHPTQNKDIPTTICPDWTHEYQTFWLQYSLSISEEIGVILDIV